MKSKKYIVTSIATATLGLALLTDTAGMSPFSIQQVSAQEKSTPKNGNVKENNLPKQSEKPKDSAPKQSEKPKDSAPKQSEKPKDSAPKQSEKPKSSAPKQSEKPKSSAPKQTEKPKSSAPKQSEKPKTSTPKQTEKPKSSTPKQSEKSKGTAPKQSDKQKNTTPKQDKPKSTVQSGWVGSSYYENGVKVTNKWIFDKKANSYFYLNASGNAVRNAWVGNYYLKSDGKRAKSDWIYDKNSGSYYYLTAEGSSARNKWIGNYYLKSDGKMAKNEWVDGGRYYVDPNGLWLPKSTDGDPYAAALNEAKSYNRIHLSKKRIYKTLILFGFNSDVAQYTIDHLYADYKANALATARNNRKYSKLSKTEIYERLVSSSYFNGEFTKEEANYAIQHLDD